MDKYLESIFNLNHRRSDLTPFESELDAMHEQFQRQQETRKATIIGSAVEMDWVIRETENPLRLKIMKLIADLTDAGLELSNPRCHKDLPEQTKEMVIELAKAVENAIEEFVDNE